MFHWKDETTHASQDATTGATASQYSKISMVFDMELEDVFGEGVATEIKKPSRMRNTRTIPSIPCKV